MKTITAFLILMSFCQISCEKDEFDLKNPDVDEFIIILRGGNYFDEIGYELPDFTMKHIDRLLSYVEDTSAIKEFPTNPFSSKYTEPKILNECLFWTIDGVRFGNKYPSLEPCLIDTTSFSEIEGYSRLTGRKLLEVADLYLLWYNEYKANPSSTLKTKNIFEDTSYSW